jgi:translation initiation factor IF-2
MVGGVVGRRLSLDEQDEPTQYVVDPASADPSVDGSRVGWARQWARPRMVALGTAGGVLIGVLILLGITEQGGDRRSSTGSQSRGSSARPWWEDSSSGPVDLSRSGLPTPPASKKPSKVYLIVGPDAPGASKAPSSKPAPAPPSARPPSATFTAVTGDECPHDATKGYKRIGAYSDGSRGWYGRSSGGWTGDGCQGAFDALPMSGYRDRDDTSAFVVWWFKPAQVRQGSCVISVYIPTSRSSRDVAGAPAFYNVIAGRDDYRRIAGFAINQANNRGQWVNAGSYPLRNGQIGIQLITRGEDPNGEHLAAAQVKAACRAS